MIMTIIYRLIALFVFVFVGRDFLLEESPSKKINDCMVLAPLILRILMIK